MKQIAVLLTCHNRREKTLSCLAALYACVLPEGYGFDVFLVDDGCTDGTADAVKAQFQHVNIIQGTGNLYWNQGMRLAWEKAIKYSNYDYFLWLNDDTLLNSNAIKMLCEDYDNVVREMHNPVIVVGSCCDDSRTNFTYGGRTIKGKPIVPDGIPHFCTLINGNVVLVPQVIFNVIGNLSSIYTHSIGDYDYALRAKKNGFNCITTSQYIAICNRNGIPLWINPDVKIINRIKNLYAINGFCLLQCMRYTYIHFGLLKTVIYFLYYNIIAIIPYINKFKLKS